MFDTIDLNGSWSGYYVQFGQRRPISAHFWHDGRRLSGTMTDAQTSTDVPFAAVAADFGLSPTIEGRFIDRLRARDPEVPDGPLHLVGHLPADSVLDGTVSGRDVRFLKTYQGDYTAGHRIGSRKWVRTRPGPTVHYQGVLGDDGQEIAGLWWIRPKLWVRLLTPLRDRGEFLLRRGGTFLPSVV